jgi:hypothetical protein
MSETGWRILGGDKKSAEFLAVSTANGAHREWGAMIWSLRWRVDRRAAAGTGALACHDGTIAAGQAAGPGEPGVN